MAARLSRQWVDSAHQCEDLRCGMRDVASRTEDGGDTRVAQERVVGRRDHTADDHDDLVRTLRAQRLDELGYERLVPRSLARDAPAGHVVLHRFARGFPGPLEQ